MIELFPVFVVLMFSVHRLVKAGSKGELGQALRTFISPTEEWGPRFVIKNGQTGYHHDPDQYLILGRTQERRESRTRGSLSRTQLFAQLTQFKCAPPNLNVFGPIQMCLTQFRLI